ncbi:MAG: YqeG family HAD IIIA-type phosphatase [Dictyoglomaceae bacterium]|nr:YqeG family HAD IIIA-type phosphatase [Dictyoglomaceae bacterium]
MWKELKPKRYIRSIFKINFEKLYKDGFRGIIFDLDNTIVPWNETSIDSKTLQFLDRLKEIGFKIIIISNNWSVKRVRYYSTITNIPAIGSALKPRNKAFKKALDILKTSPKTTLVIGDRILTDIWGGNRLGMYTILVSPLNRNEIWIKKWTVRLLENLLIKFWIKKGYLFEEA